MNIIGYICFIHFYFNSLIIPELVCEFLKILFTPQNKIIVNLPSNKSEVIQSKARITNDFLTPPVLFCI